MDTEEMQRWGQEFRITALEMLEATDGQAWRMFVSEGGIKDRETDVLIGLGMGEDAFEFAHAALVGVQEQSDSKYAEDVAALATQDFPMGALLEYGRFTPLGIMDALNDPAGMPYFLLHIRVISPLNSQPIPFTIAAVRGKYRCQFFSQFLGVTRARVVEDEDPPAPGLPS